MNTLSRIAAAAVCLLSLLPEAMALDTSTRIFDPAFRTLKVQNPDDFMAPPVIRLNTSDRLTVSFDQISDDNSYLQYRLLHCDADWQPSRLVESEYVDGFNQVDVDDYAYSSGTFIHYVNYRIEIPAPGAVPLVSGNYLLQVYPQGEPDNVLLQARFQVSENRVGIGGQATARTDRGVNTEWQQLALELVHPGFPIQNVYSDLMLVIEQNGRPDSRRVLTRPLRVQGDKVIYEHMPELIFPAGNEFRRFETVRSNYAGMGVDSTAYIKPCYNAWLVPATPRTYSEYTYDRTQQGRFKIDEYNASDPDLAADYILTHFTLAAPEITGADVYVDGEFTAHRLDPQYRMAYDRETGLYTLALPLKQGSYNWQTVVRPRDGGASSPAPVEGNKYETCNEYTVSVYLKEPTARYDRLVGTAQIFSQP